MKRIVVGSCLLVLVAANAITAAAQLTPPVSSQASQVKEPAVQVIDGKVSIQANAVPLRQFLQLLDAATGMTSKVAPALANEKISVRLEGMDLAAAIRKSFQGQPWNYFVAEGKGITIIDKAAAIAPQTGGISSSPVQPIETRNDNPPPPVASALSAPVPAAAPANAGANAGNQPNLPPAQGGASTAPTSTFAAPGSSLAPIGVGLPTAQPAR